jgi:hypothetical protein
MTEITIRAEDYLRKLLAEAEAERDRLRDALQRITERKGRFSRDPLTHASNTIEDMAGIAERALQGEGDA